MTTDRIIERYTSGKVLIGILLLAGVWLIVGLSIEEVFGKDFILDFWIFYWVIFFGILVALYIVTIIVICRSITIHTKKNTFTTANTTWWEKEKSTRAIGCATVGAISFAFLGVFIVVDEGGWAILTTEREFIKIAFLALFGALIGVMGIDTEDRYLFSWNEVPGNYNSRLVEFIEQRFYTDWVKAANIEKIDNGKTIKVYSKKNYLLLSLNDEETEMDLKIDDGRIANFIVKAEKGKLNIYEEGFNLNM
ncbi:MAG: hypothetical protein K8R25_12340 [Methanosarcinales archaeon]|nr:hypothetical protein [Methanosarcinales archaeon]